MLNKLILKTAKIQIEIPREEYINAKDIHVNILTQYSVYFDSDICSSFLHSDLILDTFNLGIILKSIYNGIEKQISQDYDGIPEHTCIKLVIIY